MSASCRYYAATSADVVRSSVPVEGCENVFHFGHRLDSDSDIPSHNKPTSCRETQKFKLNTYNNL